MRGYFSFLIVFAACLLTISLAQFNINAKYSNSAGSIWVERYHQAEMNIKEAVVEAVREGVVEGIVSYSESYARAGCADRLAAGDVSAVPNIDCIEHHINKKTIEKINALNGQETNGMRFFVSIDPEYAVSTYNNVCEEQPCGVAEVPAEKQVVQIFNLDPAFLPADSPLLSFDEGEKALEGATIQISKDSYTQRSPITITIKNAGFDDVAFNMPPAEINGVRK